MGQLIMPNEIKIKGPWILDENQLEELNETLVSIEAKIDEYYEIELEKEIDQELPRLIKWNENITKNQAKAEVEKNYPFRNNEKFALLQSKDGKRLKDKTIINLLKDKNITDFKPIELQLEIIKGPINFKLEINSLHNGELRTNLSIKEDSYSTEINYILNKWIRKNQPNIIVQFWGSILPFIIFPLYVLLFLGSGLFLKTDLDNYKYELKKDGRQILINGINDNNHNKAIELILKLETNYIPANYKNAASSNNDIFKVWLYGSICFAFLTVWPKTTIGIGRKKRLASFYKMWIYVVTVFIPLTILLPIIKAKFL